ncbi:MAG: BrnT family toxin [Chloroflexi bacterium]|nr:BrnT family toxin [Chloroflexota bacterium]
MKTFAWNTDKSILLKEMREISFEEIVFYIEKGFLLDVLDHPNKEKYPNQKIFVVQIDDYAYLIPFVEDEKEIFLKTIIPSRKATKKYLQGDEND